MGPELRRILGRRSFSRQPPSSRFRRLQVPCPCHKRPCRDGRYTTAFPDDPGPPVQQGRRLAGRLSLRHGPGGSWPWYAIGWGRHHEEPDGFDQHHCPRRSSWERRARTGGHPDGCAPRGPSICQRPIRESRTGSRADAPGPRARARAATSFAATSLSRDSAQIGRMARRTPRRLRHDGPVGRPLDGSRAPMPGKRGWSTAQARPHSTDFDIFRAFETSGEAAA